MNPPSQWASLASLWRQQAPSCEGSPLALLTRILVYSTPGGACTRRVHLPLWTVLMALGPHPLLGPLPLPQQAGAAAAAPCRRCCRTPEGQGRFPASRDRSLDARQTTLEQTRKDHNVFYHQIIYATSYHVK